MLWFLCGVGTENCVPRCAGCGLRSSWIFHLWTGYLKLSLDYGKVQIWSLSHIQPAHTPSCCSFSSSSSAHPLTRSSSSHVPRKYLPPCCEKKSRGVVSLNNPQRDENNNSTTSKERKEEGGEERRVEMKADSNPLAALEDAELNEVVRGVIWKLVLRPRGLESKLERGRVKDRVRESGRAVEWETSRARVWQCECAVRQLSVYGQ